MCLGSVGQDYPFGTDSMVLQNSPNLILKCIFVVRGREGKYIRVGTDGFSYAICHRP
ncbi:hypothetical protein SCLCIDRAFT_1215150 [Scleroderma citrinum Foug A]|uniref:Uncharacterized protein n=1 Tax=Scleroderma citrinum Foug A TaxID=1036808 RepID=A0A0C3ACA1_9AGAM|nr:hypothetical protein SCLCIDRAFT_1215150 [Scleroderma citrinum Foug A]